MYTRILGKAVADILCLFNKQTLINQKPFGPEQITSAEKCPGVHP